MGRNKVGRNTVFAIAFFDMMGVGILLPLLPSFGQKFAVSAIALGFLSALFPLTQTLASPVLGWLSDRIGRRLVLIFALCGAAAAYANFAIATAFWWLLLARAGAGICSGSIPVAQAYLSERTASEARTGVLAQFGMMATLGFIAGLLLASFGPDRYSFSFGAVAAIALGLAVLGYQFFDRDAVAFNTNMRSRLAGGTIVPFKILLLGTHFLNAVLFTQFMVVLPLWTARFWNWDTRAIGTLLVGTGICIALTLFFAASRIERGIGARAAVTTGFFGQATGALIIILSHGGIGLALFGVFLVCFGYAILIPITLNILVRDLQPSQQGSMFGIASGVLSAGSIVGPMLGGVLFQVSPFSGSFVLIATVGTLSAAAVVAGFLLLSASSGKMARDAG